MEVTAFPKTGARLLRVVAAAIAASMSCAASAALITVGPDPDCDTNSLPAAMIIAGLNGTDFDEIRVMQGTYTNVVLSSSGISYSLTGGYNHCRLGAQPVARTNLVGNFYDSVLSIAGATSAYHNVTLAHLNISNGGSRQRASFRGGGIKASNLRLVLADVALINNSAADNGEGGGISITRDANAVSGILELQGNVRFTGNVGGVGGGLSSLRASVRIRPDEVSFDGNRAGFWGGAIALDQADLTVGSFGEPESSVTATGLAIRDNRVEGTTGLGGGLYAAGSLVDLRETAFVGNRAARGAGLLVIDSQLQVGRDSVGVGVSCPSSAPCMRFEDNWTGNDCTSSRDVGGAIALFDSRAFIHQAKFTGNCATRGAVLAAVGSDVSATAIDIEGVLAYDNYNSSAWQPSIAVSGARVLRIRYSTLVRNWTIPSGGTAWEIMPALEQQLPTPDSYARASAIDVPLPAAWGGAASTCNLLAGAGTFRGASAGDFRLAATAGGAIDRCGIDVAPIDYTDLERKLRCTDSPAHADGGGRCDIGAFEYDDDPFGDGFRNSFE